jgi:diguanylate cyclase (GGDEF)-like protein
VKNNVKKIEGPEKLIIVMMAVVGIVGVIIGEMEVKLICAILFVIGGFILFMSISSKAKNIISEEEIPEKISSEHKNLQDESLVIKTPVKNDKIHGDDDFIVIKSIPNGKNSHKQNNDKNNQKITNNIAQPTTAPIAEPVRTENKAVTTAKTPINEKAPSHFFDVDFLKVFYGDDPKNEFKILLDLVLKSIKNVTFANTVAFFWVNTEKDILVFESCATGSDQFILKKKDTFPLGSNLMGKIAVKGKPEIVSQTNFDAERDLLGYYKESEFVKSIIGIPVFFDEMVVGVIIIDSKDEDAYGMETIELLTSFVDLVACLIRNSTEKYDYFIDSMILNKLEQINQSCRNGLDMNRLVKEILESLSVTLLWDFISFCYFDQINGEWRVQQTLKKDPKKNYIANNSFVDVENTIISYILKERKFALIDDLESVNIAIFNRNESIERKGSLIAMPIFFDNRVYGSIVFHSMEKEFYSIDDAGMLSKFCSLVSNLLGIASLKEYIHDKIKIDEITNIPNKENFFIQLDSSLSWVRDFKDFGSFILVSIDKLDELQNRFGVSGLNMILISVVQVLNSSKEPYHLLGRIGENCFGLYLMRYTLDECKVFAEKIRKNIASNIIIFQNKSFSVTISLGIVEVKVESSIESIIENSAKALKLAIEEGGNRVKIL